MRILKLFCLIAPLTVFSQADNSGAGRAIQFDGVDDLITIGDRYHDLVYPFSVSAWVKVDPTYLAPTPILVLNDNDPMYHGFWFSISSGAVLCEYGDGFGGNNPTFRNGKVSYLTMPIGNWINVTAVMREITDGDLYVNGIKLNSSNSGGSSLAMSKSVSGDIAKIGYFLSNGVIYRFKGVMDEVRLWNRALTQTEIQTQMCVKLTGNETGLIGYWDFNETSGNIVFDKSPNHFDGTLQGNPSRVYSGAPIGDASTFFYPTSWSGNSLTLTNNPHVVTISNVSLGTPGVHIYEVKDIPSQTGGLAPAQITSPYFGVYTAALIPTSTFNISYLLNGNNSCGIKGRDDNSVVNWVDKSLTSLVFRQEFIPVPPAAPFTLDLGPDKVVCDVSSYTINTGVDPSDKTFQWNTGATTSSINITTSGNYSVTITSGCTVKTDAIDIQIKRTPPAGFSLGDDETWCKPQDKLIQLSTSQSDYDIFWDDGSIGPVRTISTYGKYWVRIENYCGVASDTIEFKHHLINPLNIPNVLTANDDNLNRFFLVEYGLLGSYLAIFNRWGKLVFKNQSYQNDWDAEGLDAGVYYYLMKDKCLSEFKGFLTIIK